MIQKLNNLKAIMSGKDPDVVFNNLMQSNPQFRSFVEQNKGRNVEDIAMDYDIDLDMLKRFM